MGGCLLVYVSLMDAERARVALAALGNETRLAAVRKIVASGGDGTLPSTIADSIGIPRNLMSAHLVVLERAGLIVAEQRGRNRLYRVRPELLREVATLLLAFADGRESR